MSFYSTLAAAIANHPPAFSVATNYHNHSSEKRITAHDDGVVVVAPMISADFAAAQARVVALRREREAQLAAQHAQQPQVHVPSPIARLPAPAQQWWSSITSQWETISGREGTRPAFRVGQVDSELLDDELLELLKNQVGDALKYYGAHLRDDYAAEIALLLRAVLFKFTIWDKNASYGASLQNLRYTDARDTRLVPGPPKTWQKALYGLVSVGGRYAWTKWEDYLLDSESGYEEPSVRVRTLSRLSSMLSTGHSMAAFASFLFFLLNGKYRTILDRVFRMRLAPTTNQVHREVSFEYLNRQLVWHAFTEFLLFLLPLIGIHRWRRWLARAWRNTRTFLKRGGDDGAEAIPPGGELGFLPERTCAICYHDQNMSDPTSGTAAMSGVSSGIVGSAQTDITNPYEAIPCGCVYCYICLAQRLEAEDGEGWPCLRCGEVVHVCKPWGGDVLEESRSRSSSGKSVTFADEDDHKKSNFTELEPIPLEDEKVGEVEADIEEDVDENAANSLETSEEWTGGFDNALDASQAFVGAHDDASDDGREHDSTLSLAQDSDHESFTEHDIHHTRSDGG